MMYNATGLPAWIDWRDSIELGMKHSTHTSTKMFTYVSDVFAEAIFGSAV